MHPTNTTHGTLTNKKTGATIAGILSRSPSAARYFSFTIDGTTVSNAFRLEEWDFTPTRPPEPPIRLWYRDDTLWFKRAGEPVMVVSTCQVGERTSRAFSDADSLGRSPSTIEYTPKEDA